MCISSYANTGYGADRRSRTPDIRSTKPSLYRLSYASMELVGIVEIPSAEYESAVLPLNYTSLCVSPLDFHIPDCSPTKATPLHPYMARAGRPHATRPRGSFQERIVILCGVSRNAHIIQARPDLSCQWWDSNPRPRVFKVNIPYYDLKLYRLSYTGIKDAARSGSPPDGRRRGYAAGLNRIRPSRIGKEPSCNHHASPWQQNTMGWQGWHDLNVRISVSKTDALTAWLQPLIKWLGDN